MSLLKAAIFLFVLASLSACIGIETGLVGDEREAYIRSIKSALADWQKIGTSKNQIMQASFECGGCNCDHGPNIGSQDVAKKKNPDESYMQTYWRIAYEWESCRVEKGYSYVGACETEYAKAGPGCRARQASNVIAPRD